MPLIPALERQMDFWELEASLSTQRAHQKQNKTKQQHQQKNPKGSKHLEVPENINTFFDTESLYCFHSWQL